MAEIIKLPFKIKSSCVDRNKSGSAAAEAPAVICMTIRCT